MARIHISSDPSGRIIVSLPYDPLLVEKVKSIGGRKWHPIEKHWSFPDTVIFGDFGVRQSQFTIDLCSFSEKGFD